MGKTKIKTIDDSAQAEEKKKPFKKKVKEIVIVSEAKQSSTDEEDRHVESNKVDSPRDDKKTEPKKTTKPGKAKPRSKKYQQAIKNLDRTKTYPIEAAVDMVKKLSYAKFNGTLEAHINTGQTGITGYVSLPFASGEAGKTEYKTESKAPIIHLGLGKLDQPTEELSANVKTLLQTLGKTRIKKVSLSPTMGPSVKVNLSSF